MLDLFPNGEYPLRIASVTVDDGNLKTKVTENNEGTGSIWTEGDTIAVYIPMSGTGIYTLTSDGKIKSTLREVYWKDSGVTTIYAWYPAHADNDLLEIDDQSKGLKYVLRDTIDSVTYKDKVHLVFKNQLAKVRIKVTGSLVSQVSRVALKGFTDIWNVTDSYVPVYPTNENWIYLMKKTYPDGEYFEANLGPQTINVTGNFLQIDVGHGLQTYPINSSIIELLAGHSYTFNVQVQDDIWSNHVFQSKYDLISSDLEKISSTMNGTGILRIKGSMKQGDLDTLISRYSHNLKYFDMSDVDFVIDKPTMPIKAFDNFEGYTFQGCSNLKSVYIADVGEKPLSNFYLRDLYSDFKDCISLTSIVLPKSLWNIGDYSFENCIKLRTFVVPRNVRRIGRYSFSGCSSLTSVVLQGSLKDISDYAFKDCFNLRLIKCKAYDPPSLSKDVFKNVPPDCVLKVPPGYLSKYKAAYGWKDFKNIEEFSNESSAH